MAVEFETEIGCQQIHHLSNLLRLVVNRADVFDDVLYNIPARNVTQDELLEHFLFLLLAELVLFIGKGAVEIVVDYVISGDCFLVNWHRLLGQLLFQILYLFPYPVFSGIELAR